MDSKRPADLIEYTYNQLCFNFDNLRGYTVQLLMGDNNLLSLGLNGTLERFYPEVKAALLSPDKSEYYAGFTTLLGILSDGGHTSTYMGGESFEMLFADTIVSNPALIGPYRQFASKVVDKQAKLKAFVEAKTAAPGSTPYFNSSMRS